MSRVKKACFAMLLAVFLVCAAGFAWACAGVLSARAADDATAKPDRLELTMSQTEFDSWTSIDTIRGEINGTIHFENGATTDFASERDNTVTTSVTVSDMRPQTEEETTAGTYARTVHVSYTSGGKEVTADLEIQVNWLKPTNLSVETSMSTFNAGTTVENSAFTVTAQYVQMQPTIKVFTRTLSAAEFTITYQNGNVITFDDEYLTISYVEGKGENACTTPYQHNFPENSVIEAPIDAPVPTNNLSAYTTQYEGAEQSWNFTKYNTSETEEPIIVRTEGGEGEIRYTSSSLNATAVFYATNAGEYRITFNAKTGFQYRLNTLPDNVIIERKDPDNQSSPIIGVTYTWTIKKVKLQGVTFALSKNSWTYGEEAAEVIDLKAAGVGEESSGVKLDTAAERGGAVVPVYNYTGEANPGSPWNEGTVMPSDGGSYKVGVSLTGMKNYKDYTTPEGSEISFTISRKEVALPTAEPLSFDYDREEHAPTVTHKETDHESLYTTSNPPRTSAGNYEATFTLKEWWNYCWAGETPQGQAVYSIAWSIEPSSNSLTLAMDGWTYGEAAHELTVDLKFGEKSKIQYTWQYRAFGTQEGEFAACADPREGTPAAGYYRVQGYLAGTNDYEEETSAWAYFTIDRKEVDFPVLTGWESFVYDGNEKSPTVPTNAGYTHSGTTQATDAGDYSVKFTLNENYRWKGKDNESTVRDHSDTWTILRKGVAKPDAVQTKTYDGTQHSYSYESSAYTVTSEGATDAGKYDVTFSLNGNYCWDTNGSDDTADYPLTGGLVILRSATLEKPAFEDAKNTVYDETVQKKTVNVNEYQSGYMDFAASVGAAFENNTFSATDAGEYTLTITIKNNNFTWSDGGAEDPDAEQPKITLTWTIERAENAVVKEDGTSFVRTEYKGWAFGNEPTDHDTLGVHAKYDDKQLTAQYAYYLQSDTGLTEVPKMTSLSDVGNYVLRVIIPEGKNTKQAHFDFTFAITKNASAIKGTAEIETPVLAKKDAWFYKDPLTEHELTYRVMVGATEITEIKDAVVVTYYEGTEGSGTPIEREALAEAGAGEYYVTIVVPETGNYSDTSHTISFTIQKYAIAVPSFERINVYQEGSAWNPGIPTTGGEEYRGATWQVAYDKEKSEAVGTYWATLTLVDPANFAWNGDFYSETVDGDTLSDKFLNEGDTSAVRVWYRITKAPYNDMNLTIGGSGSAEWNYGGTHAEVSFNAPTDVESKVTFTITGRTDNEQDFKAENKLYSEIELYWPEDAGTYTLSINIPTSASYDTCNGEVKFTIKPKELTPDWTTTEYEYGSVQHAVISFADTDFVYGETAEDLSCFLRYKGSAGDLEGLPVNAGAYTVIVTLRNKNYCFGTDVCFEGDVYSAAHKFTVKPFTLTVNIQNPAEPTYTGEPIVPTVSAQGIGGDELNFVSDYYKQGGTLVGDKPVDAGTYYVVVTLGTGMDNYALDGGETRGADYTISPATLSVSAQNFTGIYQGAGFKIFESIQASAATVADRDKDSIEWTFTVGDEQKTELTYAGTYTVSYTVSADNHATKEGSVTFTIEKAPLKLTAKDVSAVYGTAAGDIEWLEGLNGFTVAGLVGEDEGKADEVLTGITFDYSAVGYKAGDPVGGKYGVHLDGFELANYTVETVNGDLTITPRAIVVNIAYQSGEYGMTAAEMEKKVTSALSEGSLYSTDTVSGVWALSVLTKDSADASSVSGTPNAGTYYIYGKKISTNYSITFYGQEAEGVAYGAERAFFVLEKASVAVSLAPKESGEDYLVYDGTGKGYTATLRDESLTLDFTIRYYLTTAGAHTATEDLPVNAGSYTVVATITDPTQANNYNIGSDTGVSTTFNISKATYSWANDVRNGGFNKTSFDFNDTVFKPVLKNANLIAAGEDDIEVTVSYKVQGGGEIKNAGTYEYFAIFDVKSPNYKEIEPVPGTITVNPYTIRAEDVTWQNGQACSFVYSGADQSGSVVATYSPFVNGAMTGKPVALTVSVIDGSDFINVGKYFFTVTGVADGNYTFASNITKDYSITRCAVEIKASDHADVIYGEGMPTFSREYVSGEFFEDVTVTVKGYDASGKETAAGTPVGSYFTRIVKLYAGTGVLNNYTINDANGEDWASSSWRDNDKYFGNFEIVQRNISLDAAQMTDALDRTYDGTAVAAAIDLNTVTGRFGEDTLVFTYTYEGTDVSYSSDTAPTEAGTYTVTVALAALGGQNANYTMAAKEFAFTISPAKIGSVSVEGKTVDYNGQEFRFETGVQGLLNRLSAESVNGQEISWKFSLTKGQFGEGYAIEGLTEVNDTDENIETVDAYTVYYQVSAPNHNAATGSFTVTIDRTENSWNDFYRHDGWAYKGDATKANPQFVSLSPDAEPKAVFGTNVAYKYYKTRTGDADSYVYSDEIAEPDTFFNNDTPAGTYYVQVSIAGTQNYEALTYDGTIVVRKHTLTLKWTEERLTADDQSTVTQNEVEDFDSALMEYLTASGLEVRVEDGKIVADVDYTIGTYSVTVRVKDGNNYCWDGDIVDASNPLNCIVKFTVSELENVVTITVSGDWTYGDEVTVKVIQEGTQPSDGDMISVAASSLKDNSAASAVFGYAEDTGISSAEEAASLRYSTEIPTAAGTYWVRVIVTGEEAYGSGAGYAKFEIAVRTLEKPTAMAGTLIYKGEAQTYMPQFAEGFGISGDSVTYTLPDGRKETVARISGNSYTNAGNYSAAVTLTNTANYAWAGGGEVSFGWSIAKKELAAPLFVNNSANSLTTRYDPLVKSQKLFGFDATVMGIEAMQNATYAVVDGVPSMVASDAGVHTFTVHIKAAPGTSDVYNYYWSGQDASQSGGTVTLTWTVDKFVYTVNDAFKTEYGISFENAEKEYNGQSRTLALSFADGKSLPAGLRVRYEGSATNVSEGSVTVKAVFESTNGNYAVDAVENFLSAQITVTAKQVNAQDVIWTNASFAYTAQSQKSGITAYFIGVNGSAVTLPVCIRSGQTDFKDAGSYTFALDTEKFGNSNYALPEGAEKTYEIAKRSVSVIIADQWATYNGAPHAATAGEGDYRLVGVYYEDFIVSFELSQSGGGTADFVGAGKYDIILTEECSEKLAVNYDVTVTKGVYTVEKAVAEVVWNIAEDITYDGNVHAFEATYKDVAGETQTLTVMIEGNKAFQDAGSYTFIAAFAQETESDNYVLSGTQVRRTILPRTLTVTVSAPDGLVYDGEAGEAASYTAEGLLEADEEKGYIVLVYAGTSFAGVPYSAQTAPADAGNYTVTATLSADCVNYVFAAESFLTDGYVIAKQGVATPVQKEALYYNAAAQKAAFAESLVYTSGAIAKETNAGTYYVTFTLTNENNYTWNESSQKTLDVAWTIARATADRFTIEGLAMEGWTYDGTAHAPSGKIVLRFNGSDAAVELAQGAYQYLYALAPDGDFGTAATADAGSYLMRVYVTETANYAAKSSDTVGYTVAQAVYDLSGIELNDAGAVYNGAPHTLAAEGTLPVGADGISVRVTYTYAIGGETYASMTNAGTYTVTAKFTSDSENYKAIAESRTAKYTITPASAHITWNIADGFEYDGNVHAFEATYRNVYGSEAELTVTEKEGKAFKSAGSYTFAAAFKTEEEARNYALNESETQRTVLPRTLIVTFGASDFVYDGTGKAVTANLTDEVAIQDGVTVAIAYAGTPFGDRTFAGGADAPVMAGNYTATASLENANGNFELGNEELSFTIAKARVEIPVIASKPYNHAVQTALVAADKRYTVTENEGGTDVGEYSVVVTLSDADDYVWFDAAEHEGAAYTLRWNITQAQYGKDYTLQNPVYGGEYVYDNTGKLPTQHAKIVFTGGEVIESEDNYNPLTAPIRYAYAKVESEEDVPTTGDFLYDRPIDAGIYKIVAYVPATINYSEGYNLGAISTLVIRKAVYDMQGVSLPADMSFVYDGAAHSPVLEGSLPVGLDGIQVEIAGYAYAKGSESVSSAVNAGTYTVTVNFSTRSHNYETPASVSASFSIEQKALTAQDVQWESGSFTYDGTDQTDSVKAYFTAANGEKTYLAVRISGYIPAGGDIAITANEFRNAGIYMFVVGKAGNENYVFDEPANLTLIMARSEITIELGTARGEYSGAEPADLSGVTVTVGGNYYGENLQLALVKEKGTDAGTYAVTVGEWGNRNYNITNAPRGAYVIEPKQISVDLQANAELIFDGAEKAVIWTIADGEFVAGEGLEDVTVTLIYSGTANDGTTWYGLQAPVKAGAYTATVRLTAKNYALDAETQIPFTVERANVALPTLADSGAQTVTSVETGNREIFTLKGFDAKIMGVMSDGLTELSVDSEGNLALVAKSVGTYSVAVYLKDTYNYEWADAGEDGTPVTNVLLSWTVEDAEDSIVWLIVTLSCLLVAEIVVLALLVHRGKKNGTDDGPQSGDPQDGNPQSGGPQGEGGSDASSMEENTSPQDAQAPAESGTQSNVNAYSFAPLGALLFVPVGQIGAAAGLAVACVVVGVCIVVAAVRGGKKHAEPAQEAAEPALAEEPAQEAAEPAPAEEPVQEAAEPALAEEPVQEAEQPAPAEEEMQPLSAAAEAAEEEAVTAEEEEEEEEAPESFEEEDEEEADMVLPDADLGFKKVLVRYIYSFMARLIQSSAEIKARYGEIKDEVSAYKGVKSNVSWKQERIYKGRRTIAYILFKGKKLCMAFALDPAAYSETKYRGIDMSNIKRFAKTPMLLKITSARKLRYAKHLLAEACAAAGAERGEVMHKEFLLPYRTTPELIGENLVKVLTSGEMGEHVQVEEADISALIRDKISMREARTALTDEVAAMLVEEIDESQEESAAAQTAVEEAEAETDAESAPQAAEKKPSPAAVRVQAVGKKRRGIVNIDSLSRAFAPNDLVNLATLRAKGILNPKADGVKVLARGVLDKPLTVEADDFSMDAVKMILLTGGKVRRIRLQK